MAGIVSLLAVCGVLIVKRERNRKAAEIRAGWEQFEKAARNGDEEELYAALDAILAVSPGEPRATEYRQALETGVGSASDRSLCTLLLIRHLRANDFAAAAREGRKRLEWEPNDWLARCSVAAADLAANDLQRARSELASLPDPVSHAPSPFALLFAYDLHTKCGMDTGKLRRFVSDRVTDVLGSVTVDKYPTSLVVQLLRCYLIGFDSPLGDLPDQRLTTGVQPAVRLLDRVIREATSSDDTTTLIQAGNVCDRLAVEFDRLEAVGHITAEQRSGLSKEHELRSERVWRRVLELKPAEPAAHLGLSRWHTRAGRFDEAREAAAEGLRVAGESDSLLAQYSSLLLRDEKAEEAAVVTRKAADRDPENLTRWLMAAETAAAVPRRDLALEACRRARQLAPKHPRAYWLEAQLLLGAGDANGAVQLLRRFDNETILSTPLLARAYVTALSRAGLAVTIPDFITAAEAAAVTRGKPDVAAAIAAGFADSRYDPLVSSTVVAVANRLADRWPSDPTVLSARAAVLRQAAEEGEPCWEPARTRAAISALERVLEINPKDLSAVADLAWVRLKGERSVERAARVVEPLAKAFSASTPLDNRQLTVLAAVWYSSGQADRAVSALNQAEQVGPPSATTVIHLALALLQLNRTLDAKIALAKASDRQMTQQDRIDYSAAAAAMPPEKP